MKQQLNQILKFHKIFNSYIGEKVTADIPQEVKESRVKLIREETEELIQAIENKGIKEIAHELCDVLYVVLGTAVSFGLQKSLHKVFTQVHKSNLSKMSKKGEFEITKDKSKILKGKSYKKPDLYFLLPEK